MLLPIIWKMILDKECRIPKENNLVVKRMYTDIKNIADIKKQKLNLY